MISYHEEETFAKALNHLETQKEIEEITNDRTFFRRSALPKKDRPVSF